ARALQATLPEPFLRAGVDEFLAMHPDRSALGAVVSAPGGGQRIELTGEGRRLLYGFHHAVAALVAAGNQVIVDDLLVDRAVVEHWHRALDGWRVLMVGLRCPLDDLERREARRAERTPGLARGYFTAAHQHVTYDLEVCTAPASPVECAASIADAWQAARSPSAGTPPGSNVVRSRASSALCDPSSRPASHRPAQPSER